MPAYSELLRRAIFPAGAKGNDRHEVYAKARAALILRLREARTAPRDITRERLLLEKAVCEVETEAADQLRTASIP